MSFTFRTLVFNRTRPRRADLRATLFPTLLTRLGVLKLLSTPVKFTGPFPVIQRVGL